MNRIVALAPAKLNLGLEVVGRRPDGYHDLVTIMQTISLYDRLTVESASDLTLTVSDPALAGPDNLALKAARALRAHARIDAGASLHLDKAIPTASGLGGASSDAATTLLALRRLWELDLPDAELAELAASLGSDVPFFLQGGTALVTGRGDQIESLPPLPPVWFVVVVPTIEIQRKTATLYGLLKGEDFTAGTTVRRQADRLRAGAGIDAALLRNAFSRALAALRPDVAQIMDILCRVSVPGGFLTGAGPGHYLVIDDRDMATRIATELEVALPLETVVFVCKPVEESLLVQAS
jgi:4-diphosphocytidyl-2-C-methyl-D-erythritol kinase